MLAMPFLAYDHLPNKHPAREELMLKLTLRLKDKFAMVMLPNPALALDALLG